MDDHGEAQHATAKKLRVIRAEEEHESKIFDALTCLIVEDTAFKINAWLNSETTVIPECKHKFIVACVTGKAQPTHIRQRVIFRLKSLFGSYLSISWDLEDIVVYVIHRETV